MEFEMSLKNNCQCEDSSNFFKTPMKVHRCQTWKLKSLIKLVLLKKL